MKNQNCPRRMRSGLLLAGLSAALSCSALTANAASRLSSDMPVARIAGQQHDRLLGHMGTRVVLDQLPAAPHVLPLDLDRVSAQQWPRYAALVEESLEQGGIVVLTGRPEALQAVRPAWIQVWPGGDAIVINSRWGVRVDALSHGSARNPAALAELVEDQLTVLDASAMPSAGAAHAPDTRKTGVARSDEPPIRHVEFSIRPTSPTETCTAFGNGTAAALPQPVSPEVRASLVKELRRWCQSGTLADIQPGVMPLPMGQWWRDSRIQLNLLTEWALIRSEDTLQPDQSRSYVWVKTIGEGAGSGFVRDPAWTAHKSYGYMKVLADVAIHHGWGQARIGPDGDWSYPTPPAYWPARDPKLFACDFADPGEACPSGLRLVSLFPSDSFNDEVNVSTSTAISYGGSMSVGADASGPNISLGLSVENTETFRTAANYKLTEVSTNSTRRYSRTTRWRPNVPAIWDYLVAGRITGPFGSATPTASNLNPRYDAIWMLPLAENAGKTFNLGIVFEAGVNYCVRAACAGLETPSDPVITSQRRGLWESGLQLKIQE